MGIEMGHVHDLARRIEDLESKVEGLTTQDLLQNASIGAGGLTVEGGGGITITGGGSLTVTGTGTLNVASGGLNSAGSISAGTTITAGGNIVSTGGDVSGLNVHATAGNVTSTGDMSAGGQVSSNGSPFKSQPSYGYHVATSYQAVWIDGATYQIGISASSEIVKTALTPMTADDARKLLNLTPYWGRYVWDAPDSPLKVFFLAADVQAAGFGPDVAPVALEPIAMLMPDGSPVVDANGEPCVVPVGEAYSINYSQLVVPLIAAWHDGALQMQTMQATVQTQATQIASLEARLTAAGIA